MATLDQDRPKSSQTRARLLDAAGEVFAEHGFRSATIRDICRRARANIAAVNYHFGDKRRLYTAVFRYAYDCALEKYPPDLNLSPACAPEDRLRAFIRAFLCRIFDEGRPAWHGRLMAREMAEPTGALDDLVEQSIRPQFELLQSIARELLGRRAGRPLVRSCAFSVVGQCLYYWHGQQVIRRLFPEQRFGPSDVAQIADHIASFSLAALRSRCEPAKGVRR